MAQVTKAEYKSATRSKKMIREAYILVLQNKAPEKITVTDIVRAADINRSTFYAHYKSPHDVLMQIADEVIEEINLLLKDFKFVSFVQDSTIILTKFCEYLEENQAIYQKLMPLQGVNIFMNQICDKLYDFIKKDPSVPKKLKKDSKFKTAARFFVNAIVYSFRDKISGVLDVSYKDLVTMINYLISRHFTAMLEYVESLR